MKKRQGLSSLAWGALTLTLISLIMFVLTTQRREQHDGGADALTLDGGAHWPGSRNSLPKSAVDQAQHSPYALEKLLGPHDAQKPFLKNEVIDELESLVAQEKARYNIVVDEYKNAIKAYEELSSDFDAMVHDEARRHEVKGLDKDLQSQAQEILKFERLANTAYTALMAKYDEVVPLIMARHF